MKVELIFYVTFALVGIVTVELEKRKRTTLPTKPMVLLLIPNN